MAKSVRSPNRALWWSSAAPCTHGKTGREIRGRDMSLSSLTLFHPVSLHPTVDNRLYLRASERTELVNTSDLFVYLVNFCKTCTWPVLRFLGLFEYLVSQCVVDIRVCSFHACYGADRDSSFGSPYTPIFWHQRNLNYTHASCQRHLHFP